MTLVTRPDHLTLAQYLFLSRTPTASKASLTGRDVSLYTDVPGLSAEHLLVRQVAGRVSSVEVYEDAMEAWTQYYQEEV